MIFRDPPGVKTLEKRRLALASTRSLRFPQTALSILLLIPLVLPASAQENENAGIQNESIVETIAKPASVLYEPNNRTDPFLHIVPSKTAARPADDEEIPRGTPPPGIEGTFIDKAGLEGIVIHYDNRRMAVVRSEDNRAYFLYEGDRLFDGYLKTIDDDSVVFVRETLMRSGRIRTQEVTRRLREL